MCRRPLQLTLLAISLAILTPLAAAADQGDDYRQMLELSAEAAQAVETGQFGLAAIKFRQAYATYPDPILLKNEMIAWFHADECANALPPGEAFLDTEDVQPEDEEDVEAVQIECHLRLAGSAVDDEVYPIATYYLDTLPPIERTPDEERRYQQLRSAIPTVDTEEPDPVGPPSQPNHFAWAQIAGGIALTGVTLSMHAVALDRQSQLRELSQSNDPTRSQLLDERLDQWSGYQRTTRWLVPVLYVVGLGAIGSGTYFLVRDSSFVESNLALSPTVTSDQFGIAITHQF